jgi:asparagine synthase (glutamine-hydrolysing)
MCGIFGFITNDFERAREISLLTAVRTLAHRGPDDKGIFEMQAGDVWCKLAQTRLSIIDPSDAGHQPFLSSNGRYALVYNGEIYNFREVHRELVSLGETFVSDCDTEVVLKSYMHWGRECVRRFRGMFAFGIWDAQLRSLFLARDRLGIKPLYYAVGQKSFAFASEIRTLLATGAVKRELSFAGLQSYFTFGSIFDPVTIIEGVNSLLPGHCLTFCDGEMRVEPYWTFPVSERMLEEEKETRKIEDKTMREERAERLKSLLREAVRLWLIADAPVGIFLSGGIDSSAIVALAAEVAAQPLQTLTVTFDEQSYSEARYAEMLARQYGCEHREVHLSAERMADQIERVFSALDQPSADGVNTYFVSKAAREAGLKVALSGLGGDEVFGGYANFRRFERFVKISGYARLAPGFIFDYVVDKGANASTSRERKLFALLETQGDPNSIYAVLRGMFTPDQQRRLLGAALAAGEAKGRASRNKRVALTPSSHVDYINLYSQLELEGYLRNTLLRDTDVMSMAHGLEVRVPLLDHVLVEYVAQLPGHLKIASGINKPLLLNAVPTLSQHATRRPKMGFTLPMAVWFRGKLKPLIEDLLLAEAPRRLSFLNADEIRRLWQAFMKSERHISHSRIWCIAALIRWCVNNNMSV